MSRRGLTLLEVMVALVILSLVALSSLELFGTSARASRDVDTWIQVVNYAAEGIELAKFDLEGALGRGIESLEGGFQRQIGVRSWEDGLEVVTVLISFPGGGQFQLERLIKSP